MTSVLDREVGAEARARRALEASSFPALRGLRVEMDGEQLVLRGRLASFYFKQVAQEVVRNAARDAVVVNEIDVC